MNESVKVGISVAVKFFRIVPELYVMEEATYFNQDAFLAMNDSRRGFERTIRVEVSHFLSLV